MIDSDCPIIRLSDPSAWTIHCYFDITPESPGGRRVAMFRIAPDKASGQVLVVNADGTDRREVGEPIVAPMGPNWHHGEAAQQWLDDRRIVHNRVRADGRPISAIVDVDTGELRTLDVTVRMIHPSRPLGITSSHEMNLGTGGDGEPQAVFKVDLDSGAVRRLFDVNDVLAIHPLAEVARRYDMRFKHTKWSPDGTRFLVVFHNEHLRDVHRGPDRVKSIILADADGGTLRYLGEFGHHPMWSPDGRDVLTYERRADGGQSLVARPADGGERRTLLDPAPGAHGSLDPAATTLVTDTVPGPGGGDGAVFTLDLATGARRTLATFTHPPISLDHRVHPHPAWSRDGRRVYFNAAPDGTAQVFAVEVE